VSFTPTQLKVFGAWCMLRRDVVSANMQVRNTCRITSESFVLDITIERMLPQWTLCLVKVF
jgi:hypothetical protein